MSARHLTGHGVSSRRKHKHQRHGAVGVQVALAQVKGRRLHKHFPQLLGHVVGGGRYDLVGPEAAEDDHLLEGVEAIHPGSGQAGVVGLLAVVNGLKVVRVVYEGLSVCAQGRDSEEINKERMFTCYPIVSSALCRQ